MCAVEVTVESDPAFISDHLSHIGDSYIFAEDDFFSAHGREKSTCHVDRDLFIGNDIQVCRQGVVTDFTSDGNIAFQFDRGNEGGCRLKSSFKTAECVDAHKFVFADIDIGKIFIDIKCGNNKLTFHAVNNRFANSILRVNYSVFAAFGDEKTLFTGGIAFGIFIIGVINSHITDLQIKQFIGNFNRIGDHIAFRIHKSISCKIDLGSHCIGSIGKITDKRIVSFVFNLYIVDCNRTGKVFEQANSGPALIFSFRNLVANHRQRTARDNNICIGHIGLGDNKGIILAIAVSKSIFIVFNGYIIIFKDHSIIAASLNIEVCIQNGTTDHFQAVSFICIIANANGY